MLSVAKSAVGGNEIELVWLGFAAGICFMLGLQALLDRITANWKNDLKKRNKEKES